MMNFKKIIFVITSVLSINVYAQTQEEKNIELPEITTVVSGESIDVEKNAVLDFSTFIELPLESDSFLPVLPELETEDDKNYSAEKKTQAEKNIYVDSTIAFAWPLSFSDDFNIFKSSGKNPFSIKFHQQNINAFGNKTSIDGFFEDDTFLTGQKKINTKNFDFEFNGEYRNGKYGLQNQSESFYNLSSQSFITSDYITWNLPLGFSLDFNFDGEIYSRFSGLRDSSASTLLDLEKKLSVLDLAPEFMAKWNSKKGFVEFYSGYDFETLFGASSSENNILHRGEFYLDGGIKYTNDETYEVVLMALAGAAVGNFLGDNSVVPEFELSVASNVLLKNNRYMTINVSGGLQTYHDKVKEFEQTYKFTTGTQVFTESSDWFVSLESLFPIYKWFNIQFNCDFKTSAFGNGLWQPLYNSSPALSGLYMFNQQERTELSNQLVFGFVKDTMKITLEGYTQWMYVTPGTEPYSISLAFDWQSFSGRWGVLFEAKENLGENVDYIPVLNLTSFYRFNNSVRLSCNLNDTIKLFMGETRNIVGTPYKLYCGNVTMLLQFMF